MGSFVPSESDRQAPHGPGDVAERLHELIIALDDRAPRTGHESEPAIARDAACLREEAVRRLDDIAGDEKPASSSPD